MSNLGRPEANELPRARIGAWAMIPDPLTLEALAQAGVDFVGIDLQHGGFDLGLAFRAIQLLDALGIPAFVRVSQDELVLIPRVCDHGAAGIVVAMVESADVAARALAEARYHPDGRRSYGGQRYGLRAEPADIRDVQPEIHAMIESKEGLEAVEAIAAVPGLAGVHVGPVDLGLALGLGMDRSGAAFEAAIDRIIAASRRAGIAATMHASWGSDVGRWRSRGFRDVILVADIALFRSALEREVATANGRLAGTVGAYGRAESASPGGYRLSG
jgi:4-hydroxy-2-oxoheptanedioate aldolase